METVVSSLQQGGLCGSLIRPGDALYDAARTPFYASFDRHPSLIVRAADGADVSRVVVVARENNLELAVRSGGHSVAGHCVSEGGIVLDLSEMRKIEIDAARRTVWADSGATAGHFTKTTGALGLATGFGDSGSVGIGGITLGGGVGFLTRKYGLTIDSLLAADLVTADGGLQRADAESNPDLFWAIRGGGGNFGVVTRFKFQLHPVDRVLGGMLVLPASPEVIEEFVAASAAAPDELSVIANIMVAPPMPFLPKEHHGRLVIMAMLVYAGAVEEGRRVVAPLRELGAPIVDMVRPIRYPEIYEVEGPHPPAFSLRSVFIDRVERKTAETINHFLKSSAASMAVAQVRVLGGAMARVPAESTAFAHRERRILVNAAAMFQHREEAAVHDEWVIRFSDALRQGDQTVYVNFLGNEDPGRVRQAYPGATWDRLRAIKRRFDPDNLFHLNHNIPPAR